MRLIQPLWQAIEIGMSRDYSDHFVCKQVHQFCSAASAGMTIVFSVGNADSFFD
jgi:hypothetical protein